jgi:opacity protein-like surface antigen
MKNDRNSASVGKRSNLSMSLSMFYGLLLLASLSQSIAQADSNQGLYYGVQLLQLNYEEDDVPDLEPTALVFRLGTMLNETFGVEGRIGAGLSKDDTSFDHPNLGNVDFEVELEHFIGIYGVAQTRLGKSASIYGLLGLTSAQVEKSIDTRNISGSVSEDESGISFGVGVNFGTSDKYRFSVEYMSYLDEDEFSIDSLSLGVVF